MPRTPSLPLVPTIPWKMSYLWQITFVCDVSVAFCMMMMCPLLSKIIYDAPTILMLIFLLDGTDGLAGVHESVCASISCSCSC